MLALLAWTAGTCVAEASSDWTPDWSDFAAAFPLSPCADGWMGCLVGSDRVTPAMETGGDGVKRPTDLRVDWFDLAPTPAFSPWSSLSSYPNSTIVVDPPTGGTGEGTSGKSGKSTRTNAEGKAKKQSVVQAKQTKAKVITPPEKPVEPPPVVRQGFGDIEVTLADLHRLEPPALLGRLDDNQVLSLEALYTQLDAQTDKDRVSRVLLSQHWADGDRGSWKKTVKRHLQEVGQSDPDMVASYARVLGSEKNCVGAIRWATVALENKAQWSGDTYVSKVNDLLKLQARCAAKRWQKAEATRVANPGDPAASADADTLRTDAKVRSREWLEYVKVAGLDPTSALRLCVSTAGTEGYCQ